MFKAHANLLNAVFSPNSMNAGFTCVTLGPIEKKLIPKVSMLPFKVNYVVVGNSLVFARFLHYWVKTTRYAAVLGIYLFNALITWRMVLF